MCHETTGANYDRPLFESDVSIIAGHYDTIPRCKINRLYEAITDSNWAQPAVLIAFLEFITRFQKQDKGLYQHPTIPFSAMDLNTFERVQTPAMAAFHSVFETFRLAQRNCEMVDNVLAEEFGLKLVFFCDCGACSISLEDKSYGDWYQEINQLRSLAEAAGTSVVIVDGFRSLNWTERQLDMGPSEMASYTRMFKILMTLPAREFDLHGLASPGFAEMFKKQKVA